jgi:hypothetical protein
VREAFDRACCNSRFSVILVSLAEFISAFFKVSCLLYIYLFITLLIILLFFFNTFSFVVKKMGGEDDIEQGIQRVPSRPLLALATETWV